MIHIPIMNLELKWFNVWEGDFAWRTVFVLVTYIICLAIVWGGKNNSGGEKAVSVKAKEPIQRKVYT